MIDLLLTFDHTAIRGGYYNIPSKNKVKIYGDNWKQGTSYQSMDNNYKGRHPFNIITSEIYDD